MSESPALQAETTADGLLVRLSGDWTLGAGAALERAAITVAAAGEGPGTAKLDISEVRSLDTAGAWVIDRARQTLHARGLQAELCGVRAEYATLLEEARFRELEAPTPKRASPVLSLLNDIGESVAGSLGDVWEGLDFLGRVVARGVVTMFLPRRWRVTPLVHHLENFALRGAPIIVLINFFVGAIVAQQGIQQLARFGATSMTVELVGILILRELAVLLTSIMVAGRSGSSITAEIGAMRMREEVDALVVMAVDPMEALVLPRLTALVIALPILTIFGDVSALFGGMCMTWAFGGVSPVAFLAGMQEPYFLQRFFAGMIKAPFMALVIGLIASAEGFAVKGSADSLGRKVTASVVKSIFLVIVLDGLFTLFYALVDY